MVHRFAAFTDIICCCGLSNYYYYYFYFVPTSCCRLVWREGLRMELSTLKLFPLFHRIVTPPCDLRGLGDDCLFTYLLVHTLQTSVELRREILSCTRRLYFNSPWHFSSQLILSVWGSLLGNAGLCGLTGSDWSIELGLLLERRS